MIIDKVKPYYTEQDLQRLEELKQEQDNILATLERERETTGQPNPDLLNKWHALGEADNRLRAEVERRYIKDHSKKQILADVEEITNAITKADFQEHIADRLAQIVALRAGGANEDSLAMLGEYAIENYENCYSFILYYLRVQLNAFARDEDSTDKVRAIVEKRVALWYIKSQPAFIPMVHGKATDAFSFMSSKNAAIDRVTGSGTIDKFGVQLSIMKLQELHATLGITTDKLLSTALATFTRQNDFRHLNGKEPNRRVTIPLKDYAQLLGYDVEEHETSTPQEAEREKRRAKNQLDNARKAVRKDLDILHASALTWEEPIKGKSRDFDRISIVTRTGIKNGEIQISFTPEIAGYLAERNLITQYPTKLLSIDPRKPTAYYVGRKLHTHFNMDNNQVRGTADRISIPALLAATDLASFEEVQKKDRGHWQERIKEPLERALDELTQEHILRDWKYTHAKGIDLTDEEAYSITSYAEYAKLYLRFTLEDKVDHTERIKAKQEARAAAKAKRAGKKKS